MRAVRCVETGHPAGVVDLAEPRPGPGQVLLKVAGAGVCHSDLHILDEDLGRKGPFTLGRENAGWLDRRTGGGRGRREGGRSVPYRGSRTELMEVIAPAAAGHLRAEVETFPPEQAVDVNQRLREGRLHGRAVLLP